MNSVRDRAFSEGVLKENQRIEFNALYYLLLKHNILARQDVDDIFTKYYEAFQTQAYVQIPLVEGFTMTQQAVIDKALSYHQAEHY